MCAAKIRTNTAPKRTCSSPPPNWQIFSVGFFLNRQLKCSPPPGGEARKFVVNEFAGGGNSKSSPPDFFGAKDQVNEIAHNGRCSSRSTPRHCRTGRGSNPCPDNRDLYRCGQNCRR